ncbi:MAG: hypothetical protein Q8N05_16140 [Bacteroidota bacterium]|nr:hypothetical protein [Bacteroidota bacterium]
MKFLVSLNNFFIEKLSRWNKNLSGGDKPLFPPDIAIVKLNSIAKEKGINDDFNKEIHIYLGGELKYAISYSKEKAEIVKETYGIPVVEDKFDEEDFEFTNMLEYGEVRRKVI